jgi:hypothetical protein
MKNVLITTSALALLGFGLLLADVKTDYSHSTDFKAYKTYSWLKVDASNSLWTDRIRKAVDKQLSAKGWTMQTGGADVAVAAIGRTRNEQSYTTFYNGLGGGWAWRGFNNSTATTRVEETPVGTLTVDMFDAKSKQLVWRSIATETLSDKPEKNTKKLDDAVADMFKKFPPKSE